MASLSNIRRAAALVAELPADAAKAMLARLNSDEVSAIVGTLSTADGLAQAVDDRLLAEFTEAIVRHRRPMVERLAEIAPNDLARAIRHEHPQTIAAVLARLPRKAALAGLAALSPDLQAEVVHRIARSASVDGDVLDWLAGHLIDRLSGKPVEAARRCA